MFLAYELLERPWAHARGQWLRCLTGAPEAVFSRRDVRWWTAEFLGHSQWNLTVQGVGLEAARAGHNDGSLIADAAEDAEHADNSKWHYGSSWRPGFFGNCRSGC